MWRYSYLTPSGLLPLIFYLLLIIDLLNIFEKKVYLEAESRLGRGMVLGVLEKGERGPKEGISGVRMSCSEES